MNTKNGLAEICKEIPDATIPPMAGVGAIALQMAMQYHDMQMIKDGALYTQYKMEGKNFRELHLVDVFETAVKIEKHLMATSDRIADIVMPAIEQVLERVLDQDESGVPFVRDPDHFEDFPEGSTLCLVGFVSVNKNNQLSLTFDDGSNSTIVVMIPSDIECDFEVDTTVLHRVYVKTESTQVTFIAMVIDEDSIPISVEQAITFVMEGDAGSIIGANEEDVFAKEREGLGDHRAAFAAFAASFSDQGLTLEDVENQMSSRQIDDVSSLVTDYIFKKYE